MRQAFIRPAEAPARINWPELLDLAERVGVRCWRYDAVRGRVVQVASIEDVDFFCATKITTFRMSEHLEIGAEMNPKKEQV